MTYKPYALLAVLTLSGCALAPKDSADKTTVNNAETAVPVQFSAYESRKKRSADSVKPLLNQALQAFQAGHYETTYAQIEKAAARGFVNSAAWVLCADAYQALGQFNESRLRLDRALSVNPHNPMALNRLATMSREKGEFKQAESYFSKAIESAPKFASSYRNRGILYDLYLSDKTKALADYEAYLLLAEAQALETKKGLKLTRQWIADMKRQIARGE